MGYMSVTKKDVTVMRRKENEMKKFAAWYAINPNFGYGDRPVLGTLKETHRKVKVLWAEDLDNVFYKMQGEVWSPNGEVSDLIRLLGLKHTSMSVGDVVQEVSTGKYFLVENLGFSELE